VLVSAAKLEEHISGHVVRRAFAKDTTRRLGTSAAAADVAEVQRRSNAREQSWD
jgi:hypothetical protein